MIYDTRYNESYYYDIIEVIIMLPIIIYNYHIYIIIIYIYNYHIYIIIINSQIYIVYK